MSIINLLAVSGQFDQIQRRYTNTIFKFPWVLGLSTGSQGRSNEFRIIPLLYESDKL
jgi:hypothetical protein